MEDKLLIAFFCLACFQFGFLLGQWRGINEVRKTRKWLEETVKGLEDG